MPEPEPLSEFVMRADCEVLGEGVCDKDMREERLGAAEYDCVGVIETQAEEVHVHCEALADPERTDEGVIEEDDEALGDGVAEVETVTLADMRAERDDVAHAVAEGRGV